MKPADLPARERDIALAVVESLRAVMDEARTDTTAWLEWSQAGTQHAGRLLIGSGPEPQRVTVPEQVIYAMADLRAQMARPGAGTWLSARVHVNGEDAGLEFNYTQRPYWNAPGISMLDRPQEPPVPDESRWAADLRRYPRDREHSLPWVAVHTGSEDESARLRRALAEAGFVAGGVALPDDEQTPLEGTVTVVRHSSAHYSVQIIDYGQHEFLAEFPTEAQAYRTVWDYLHQPLPHPTPMSQSELVQRAGAAQEAYADLHHRLLGAGPAGLITNLAAGVPFDRIGVLDGLFFFPWNTPWPQRSMPDSARGPGAQQVVLMAVAPVEVHAQIVPAWFGQPGGGIRFRVEGAPHQGIRDLVRTGVLLQVVPGP